VNPARVSLERVGGVRVSLGRVNRYVPKPTGRLGKYLNYKIHREESRSRPLGTLNEKQELHHSNGDPSKRTR